MSQSSMIHGSVGAKFANGQPSPNETGDVRVVQNLLNNDPPGQGGPLSPHAEDGVVTTTLIESISAYQDAVQGWHDGRVDPGHPTINALTMLPHPHFEGVNDNEEKRSIILRRNPEWNYSRGDYASLVQSGGSLSYHVFSTAWLPEGIKGQLLSVFATLLDPSMTPSATWGVGPEDWYHAHLAVWSGSVGVSVSPGAQQWAVAAHGVSVSFDAQRNRYLSGITSDVLTATNATDWATDLLTKLQDPATAQMLHDFLGLPEAYLVHHTFEAGDPSQRPTGMQSDDPRRYWMTRVGGFISKPPYFTPQDIAAAHATGEYLVEGNIDLHFVISQNGDIRATLGDKRDLAVFIGLDSDQFA